MRALLDAGLPVSAVISNRADAEGLKLASSESVQFRLQKLFGCESDRRNVS